MAASTELEVRLIERVAEVPAASWDALVGEGSPFLEHAWLDALEDTSCVGGDTGWLPRHFTFYRGGELLAACPVYVKTNSEGEFVYDWAWADVAQKMGVRYYPKVVVGVPFTPVTGERVLVAPGADRREIVAVFAQALHRFAEVIDASSVHVLFPGEDDASRWEDAGLRRRLHFQFHWSNRGYADVDAWLATFTSKRRNQLKREMAQPAKDGVTITTLPSEALARAEVRDAMFRFYASTVDKFFYGRRYLNRPFFDRVCDRFARRLSWVVAEKDGAMIAGAFNVKKGRRLYGRYWGADVELPFLHFNVCYYHGIRQCIAEGLEIFEPGAGGEHKYARGFEPTYTHSAHHVRDRRLASILYDFLRRETVAVREHVTARAGQ